MPPRKRKKVATGPNTRCSRPTKSVLVVKPKVTSLQYYLDRKPTKPADTPKRGAPSVLKPKTFLDASKKASIVRAVLEAPEGKSTLVIKHLAQLNSISGSVIYQWVQKAKTTPSMPLKSLFQSQGRAPHLSQAGMEAIILQMEVLRKKKKAVLRKTPKMKVTKGEEVNSLDGMIRAKMLEEALACGRVKNSYSFQVGVSTIREYRRQILKHVDVNKPQIKTSLRVVSENSIKNLVSSFAAHSCFDRDVDAALLMNTDKVGFLYNVSDNALELALAPKKR